MIKSSYTTSDGKVFVSLGEAKKHENSLKICPDKALQTYLNLYVGQCILAKHKLTDYGIWNIYGEDPNCDFGGHHHTPFLQTVEGTLETCLKYAINLKGFYTWGGGGHLTKVTVTKL